MKDSSMTIPLKDHFDDKINALKDLVMSKIEDTEKAVDTASASMNKRLEGMNEFRSSLNDQNKSFPTREEVSAQLDSVRKDINSLQISRASLEGKASQKTVMIALLFSALSGGLGIVGILIALLK